MTNIKIVLSDLHLADGHPVIDEFGPVQQSAFEGLLLSAGPSGALGKNNHVEVIINGDCFEFLAMPPYDKDGVADAATTLNKLDGIIAAHGPFFQSLRSFVATSGRAITFLAGNHDVELCFKEVREKIAEAIGAPERVNFCLTPSYQPLPDVYIEHGNQYDFWNYSAIWNTDQVETGKTPDSVTLPIGSRYMQRAGHPVSLHYHYFDHFEPSINTSRQIALLCLLDPELVVATAHRIMGLLSYPRVPLTGLAPGEERIPAKLFEQSMIDFAAYQQDMMAQHHDWIDPTGQDASEIQADALTEFVLLREALAQPPLEAVKIICAPKMYQMGESVAHGMHQVLQRNPQLRYAIAGHTHMARYDSLRNGTQFYLNTATWTTRSAVPTPAEITPELIQWLGKPDEKTNPLRNITQFTFALVTNESDDSADMASPSNAQLCIWEGGVHGNYRLLSSKPQ